MSDHVWFPIETAPTEFVDHHGPFPGGLILHFARRVRIRGAFEGEMAEFIGSWAKFDIDPNEPDPRFSPNGPGWVDEDGDPIDWPVTEWRELTPEENAALDEESRHAG